MLSRPRTGRLRLGPATTSETILKASAIATGATSTPCRVCGGLIYLGQACLHRTYHVGHSHVSCNYWALSDLRPLEREAFEAAINDRATRGDTDQLRAGGWWSDRHGWSPKGRAILALLRSKVHTRERRTDHD